MEPVQSDQRDQRRRDVARARNWRETSPVEVKVGGQAVEVRNATGWPEQTNVYRVDFGIPVGTKPE